MHNTCVTKPMLDGTDRPTDRGRCPFGESYDPMLPAEQADPYASWDRLATEPASYNDRFDPYVPWRPPGAALLMVYRHSDVLEALLDPALALHREMPPPDVRDLYPGVRPDEVGPMLFGTNVKDRKPARTIAAQAMSARRVRALEPQLRRIARDTLENVASRGAMDYMSEFSKPYVVRMLSEVLLGLPEELLPKVTPACEMPIMMVLDEIGFAPFPEDDQHALSEVQVGLVQDVLDVIEQRRAAPRGDLLSDLVHAGDAVPMADVLKVVWHIFNAMDQPYYMVGNVVQLLLEDRGRWEAIVEDPSLIPAAVDEGFRLRATQPILQTRIAVEDTTIGGVPVAKGTVVGIMPGSANRDPEVFDRPSEYYPGRPDGRKHLTFSKGEHACIGIRLAYAHTVIAVEELVRALPDVRLVEAKKATTIFNGLSRLELAWG